MSDHPQDRPASPDAVGRPHVCTNGRLRGDPAALLPCLYIARWVCSGDGSVDGASLREEGMFGLGLPGMDPGGLLQTGSGLVLPLRLCRDEAMRLALVGLAQWLQAPAVGRLSDRRRQLAQRLLQAFDGDLLLAGRQSLDGQFELQATPGLMRRLHESCDCVTGVLDDPQGAIQGTTAMRFAWRTCGELMEWAHCRDGQPPSGWWTALVPMLICGPTPALAAGASARAGRLALRVAPGDWSRWFVPRPGLPGARAEVELTMGQAGWMYLRLALDGVWARLHLSEVFDPMDEMLAWGHEVEAGDLPIEWVIDEEGSQAVLTAFGTADAQRRLLRLVRRGDDADPGRVLLEGVVSREAFAKAMRFVVRTLFECDVEPMEWAYRGDPADRWHTSGTRRRVLYHPWMSLPPA